MGAKKDRDVSVIDHKAKKFKAKAAAMKLYKINEVKIAKIEEKQERYEAWLEEIEQMNDY